MTEPFALTETQQAYLVGRGDGFALGNVSTHAYLELEGSLDAGRFTLAWRRLVDRHDMLRTVIDPARQVQRVLPAVADPPVEIVDLRGSSPEAVRASLAETRQRLSHEVRAVDRWPLFSVVVSLLGDGICRVHIGFDGLTIDWASWHVMYRELSTFYADPDAVLPPVAGFRDYLAARDRLRDPEVVAEAEAYWRDRLPTLPDAPALPLALDPATVERPRFVRREAVLDPPAWAALKQTAAAAGVTGSGVLLAAYAEVLGRWGGGDRFTLNVPSMNREPVLPEVAGMVGEFASFTLIEADLAGPGTFRDRAQRLQDNLLDALEHREVGGVRLLRELTRLRGTAGDGTRMPVVLTSTLAVTGSRPHLLEQALTQVYGITQTPQVYLDVQVEERRGALACNWDAVDALFPSGLLDAMFETWTGLLRRLAKPSTWDLVDLDLLPAPQVARRIAMAGPVRPVPDERMHDAFLRQAAIQPDAVALVGADGQEITYADLLGRATRLADRLGGWGLAGEPVAVLLHPGVDQVVAAYAVLLAGAAYLPLDPESPPERLRAMLVTAGDPAVVTHSVLAGGLGVDRVLCVDQPAAPTESTRDIFVAGPADLAYVLFTSGSTGVPKAVLTEHRGVVNCLRETVTVFGVGPGDRCLGLTAPYHDMSVFDVFGVLGAGGTLVLPDANRRTDPDHWRDLIDRYRVTVWNSVPAMLEMLLDRLRDKGYHSMSALRLAFLGGDWIPLEVARTLHREVPGARLVSVGGPTETTVWNIWYPVTRIDPDWRSIPYGAPIANTRYLVLDGRMRDCPDDVVGELYCAGVGLARGYLGDDAATAAAFVTHPGTGERLYRTGDLGRFRPDGLIEFVGRRDDQIQVGGRRIEPAEVEAALAGHPAVAQVAVVPVPREDGTPGNRGCAAHLVLAAGHPTPSAGELRAFLGERLPAYLVPGRFAIHDALPLTRNGKVDRRRLTTWEPSTMDAAPGEVGGDPVVELLATVWAQALGIAQVGPDDNFFDLGGDSLVGARILARLRDVFPGEDLSPRALMATSDVSGMAGTLAAKESVPGRMAEIAAIHLRIAGLTTDEVEAEFRALEPEREPT
jgi:amino acid adenylation domain-containing protein